MLLVALIPLLAFGGLALKQARSAMTRQILEDLRLNADRTRESVQLLVQLYEERVEHVASRTQLRLSLKEHLEKPDPAQVAKMTRIIEDARDATAGFESVCIVAPDGRIVASTLPDRTGEDISNQSFFQAGLKEVGMNHFYLREGLIATRLVSPLILDGELLGVVVIRSSLDDLIDFFTHRARMGETGETVLAR